MLRFLYAVLLGIVGAGIVHITILFMLPSYSERDIWSRVSAVAAPYAAIRLDRDSLKGNPPQPANPLLVASACRFELSDGPVHVTAPGAVPMWSMAIYDSDGLNVFGLSDRTATDRTLDLVVLTPTQMQQVRAEVPAGFERSVFVETGTEEGIVLVRVLSPDETWQRVIDAFLDGLSCTPRPLE